MCSKFVLSSLIIISTFEVSDLFELAPCSFDTGASVESRISIKFRIHFTHTIK